MGGELLHSAQISRRGRTPVRVSRGLGRAVLEIAGWAKNRFDRVEPCSGQGLNHVAAFAQRIRGERGMRLASVPRCAAGPRAAQGNGETGA